MITSEDEKEMPRDHASVGCVIVPSTQPGTLQCAQNHHSHCPSQLSPKPEEKTGPQGPTILALNEGGEGFREKRDVVETL